MDLGLRDRVYVVTGGTRGLGAATARVLVAEGARVVVSGRDGEAAQRVAVSLGGPACALGLPGDNAAPDTGERLVAAALATFGRVDGALVSGGGRPTGDALSTTDDEWRSGFEALVLGGIRIARAAAAAIPDGGCIAFVLSAAARSPIPGLALENGLRPALAMVAKMLADDLGPHGIRVNGLLPGRTSTEGLRELDARRRGGEYDPERRRALIPLGRDGTPEEFARVAAFVLSPAASYVNGAMITIDGGAQRIL